MQHWAGHLIGRSHTQSQESCRHIRSLVIPCVASDYWLTVSCSRKVRRCRVPCVLWISCSDLDPKFHDKLAQIWSRYMIQNTQPSQLWLQILGKNPRCDAPITPLCTEQPIQCRSDLMTDQGEGGPNRRDASAPAHGLTFESHLIVRLMQVQAAPNMTLGSQVVSHTRRE